MKNAKRRNRMNKKGSKKHFKREQERHDNYQRIAERNLSLPLRARVIEEVQRRCLLLGFQMRGCMLDGGADHWMFEEYNGCRILEYWPTNGRWYDRKTGLKGIEKDVTVILEMAETIFNERKKQ